MSCRFRVGARAGRDGTSLLVFFFFWQFNTEFSTELQLSRLMIFSEFMRIYLIV